MAYLPKGTLGSVSKENANISLLTLKDVSDLELNGKKQITKVPYRC